MWLFSLLQNSSGHNFGNVSSRRFTKHCARSTVMMKLMRLHKSDGPSPKPDENFTLHPRKPKVSPSSHGCPCLSPEVSVMAFAFFSGTPMASEVLFRKEVHAACTSGAPKGGSAVHKRCMLRALQVPRKELIIQRYVRSMSCAVSCGTGLPHNRQFRFESRHLNAENPNHSTSNT